MISAPSICIFFSTIINILFFLLHMNITTFTSETQRRTFIYFCHTSCTIWALVCSDPYIQQYSSSNMQSNLAHICVCICLEHIPLLVMMYSYSVTSLL